jgi:hypothetical protein
MPSPAPGPHRRTLGSPRPGRALPRRPYNQTVLQRAQTRALPVLNKSVELTPAVQACCGACRTCVTANVVTLAMAAVTGAGLYAARLFRRARIAPQ